MSTWIHSTIQAAPRDQSVEICWHLNSVLFSGWIKWQAAVICGDGSARCLDTSRRRYGPYYWRPQQDVPQVTFPELVENKS